MARTDIDQLTTRLGEIREAKEQKLKDSKCKEIEITHSKHDTFGVYKKIKEITGKFKNKSIDARTEQKITNTITGPDILVDEIEVARMERRLVQMRRSQRLISKISWVDKISNTRILQTLNKEKEIIYKVKRRKFEYLGHIMRNGTKHKLLKSILQCRAREALEGNENPG
ncbi:hypothetical protein HUJ04_008398 [Dendroctonus ponderosae]|nr:hypothetical protein HUJ04_008398 [Dendroctonus ponderosae]